MPVDVEAIKQDNAHLSQRVTELSSVAEQAKRDLKEIENLKAKVADAAASLASADQEKAGLKSQIGSLEVQVASLTSEVALLAPKAAVLDAIVAEIKKGL